MKLNDQQIALLRKFDVETPAAYANDNYDKCEFQPSKALDDLPEFLFEDAMAELELWYDKYAVRYQPAYGTSSYLLKHDLSRILANKPGTLWMGDTYFTNAQMKALMILAGFRPSNRYLLNPNYKIGKRGLRRIHER